MSIGQSKEIHAGRLSSGNTSGFELVSDNSLYFMGCGEEASRVGDYLGVAKGLAVVGVGLGLGKLLDRLGFKTIGAVVGGAGAGLGLEQTIRKIGDCRESNRRISAINHEMVNRRLV